jgi:hypothetical protein
VKKGGQSQPLIELPEVNKPQARISEVGDFHSSPIHSHTCIEVTSGTLALDDLDSCQIEFQNNLFEDLTVQMHGLCIECAVNALAVPSDEHTPLSEIVV